MLKNLIYFKNDLYFLLVLKYGCDIPKIIKRINIKNIKKTGKKPIIDGNKTKNQLQVIVSVNFKIKKTNVNTCNIPNFILFSYIKRYKTY